MKFINRFLLSWVIFVLLDPDPDPERESGSSSLLPVYVQSFMEKVVLIYSRLNDNLADLNIGWYLTKNHQLSVLCLLVRIRIHDTALKRYPNATFRSASSAATPAALKADLVLWASPPRLWPQPRRLLWPVRQPFPGRRQGVAQGAGWVRQDRQSLWRRRCELWQLRGRKDLR